MEINNALIMGAIYDPDTDCQYVLMRVSAEDWDKYQQELDLDIDALPEVEHHPTKYGFSGRYGKKSGTYTKKRRSQTTGDKKNG